MKKNKNKLTGGWIDAKKQDPPDSDRPVSYLVVLQSLSPTDHCKRWGGMGAVEICLYYNKWSGGWNPRGSLHVAFWRPCPEFKGKWNPGKEGEAGRWEFEDEYVQTDLESSPYLKGGQF